MRLRLVTIAIITISAAACDAGSSEIPAPLMPAIAETALTRCTDLLQNNASWTRPVIGEAAYIEGSDRFEWPRGEIRVTNGYGAEVEYAGTCQFYDHGNPEEPFTRLTLRRPGEEITCTHSARTYRCSGI